MEVHDTLAKMMREFDVASGKCTDVGIYSAYIPDLSYLVHALLPEVCLFSSTCLYCGDVLTNYANTLLTLRSLTIIFLHVSVMVLWCLTIWMTTNYRNSLTINAAPLQKLLSHLQPERLQCFQSVEASVCDCDTYLTSFLWKVCFLIKHFAEMHIWISTWTTPRYSRGKSFLSVYCANIRVKPLFHHSLLPWFRVEKGPFTWHDLDPRVIHCSMGVKSISIVSAIVQKHMMLRVTTLHNGPLLFLLEIAPSPWQIGPHLIHNYMDQAKSTTEMSYGMI